MQEKIKIESKDKKVVKTISKAELPTYLLRGWHEHKEDTAMAKTATTASDYSAYITKS